MRSTASPIRIARLDECCEIISGATPSRERPEYWNGSIPWATPVDISRLDKPDLLSTRERITDAGYASCSTTLLPRGAVLFSSRAPIGLVAIAAIPVCTNQGFKSLVPGPNVDSRYLYWCLRSLAPQIAAMGSGTTFAEVSMAVMGRVRVPLPDLPRQRRIAAILDKTDMVRRSTSSMVDTLSRFASASFLEVFGNPVTNSKCWPLLRARAVIADIQAGTSVSGERRPPTENEWGVLKISAVTSGRYLPSECKVVSSRPDDVIVPERGDLLFSRANTRELVAATCLVDRAVPNVFLPDKLWRIRLHADLAAPEYVHYLLAHPGFRQTLTRQATGTSGSMLNVSQEKLRNLFLPIPPIELQEKFGKVVRRVIETGKKTDESADFSRALALSLSACLLRPSGDLACDG